MKARRPTLKLPISSVGFGKRIVIRPQASKTLIMVLAGIHTTALSLLFFIELNAWLLICLAAFVLYNLVFHSSSAVLNKNALSLQQGRSLYIETATRGWQEVELVSSFICNWLLVITVRVRSGVKQQFIMIYAKDSMPSYPFRQLRVYLNLLNNRQQ